MKRTLKIAIPILFIGILGFLGNRMYVKIQQKKEAAERIKEIPDFNFEALDGTPFTNHDLISDSSVAFVYFNSGCGYCQDEAEQIGNVVEEFKNTQLIFISTEEKSTIEDFANQYNLLPHKNFHFLHDTRGDFARLFDANTIPLTLVYDQKQQLIHQFKGAIKVEVLLKYLNDAE